MQTPVIVSVKRTAIGKIGGIFRNTKPEILGAAILQALLHETGIPSEEIDEVILGNLLHYRQDFQ